MFQWHDKGGKWGNFAYIAYRWLVSIYLVAGIALDFFLTLKKEKCDPKTSMLECKAKWPIYLTNWNFLILTLQALMATFLVTRHHLYPDTSSMFDNFGICKLKL
jgi:hypothetical protein